MVIAGGGIIIVRELLAAIGLIIVWAVGCTAVPDPTTTPNPGLAEAATVMVTRPLTTAIPIPSTEILPSETPILPSPTAFEPRTLSVPRRTSTATPLPPPPTPLPLQLAENVEEFVVLNNAESVIWSPTQNEFVYYTCPINGEVAIYFASLPNFQPIELTPVEIPCYSIGTLWHPTGDYFFMKAEPLSDQGYETTDYEWKVERTNPASITELGISSGYWGWVNEGLRVFEERVGTGMFYIGIDNVITGESVANTIFEGRVHGVSQNYVVLNEELGYSYNTSVAVLAQQQISPDYSGWEFGTYVKFLGTDLVHHLFYSRFADILPATDQVLAVTWQESIDDDQDLLLGLVPANLQMWDINTDQTTLVKSDGIYGHFSPEGSYLLYLLPSSSFLVIELLNRNTETILFSQPAYAVAADYSAEVFAFTSFSPDGRFLTYYSPTPELTVYDLESGEFLPPLTAVPFSPRWSPDGTRFVYQDPASGLVIFDTRTNTAYPLAATGGERLSNPQWSYDGTYLSVTVLQTDHRQDTAVLTLP